MLILPAETTGIYYGYKSAIKTALKPQTIDPILTLLIHMTTELQTLLQASFFFCTSNSLQISHGRASSQDVEIGSHIYKCPEAEF